MKHAPLIRGHETLAGAERADDRRLANPDTLLLLMSGASDDPPYDPPLTALGMFDDFEEENAGAGFNLLAWWARQKRAYRLGQLQDEVDKGRLKIAKALVKNTADKSTVVQRDQVKRDVVDGQDRISVNKLEVKQNRLLEVAQIGMSATRRANEIGLDPDKQQQLVRRLEQVQKAIADEIAQRGMPRKRNFKRPK